MTREDHLASGPAAQQNELDRLRARVGEMEAIHKCPYCGGRDDLPPGHIERCYCLPAVRGAQQRIAELEAALKDERERLDFVEKHVDSAECSGYGADDKWWKILHHDGNEAEGSRFREAIDAARGPHEGTLRTIRRARQ